MKLVLYEWCSSGGIRGPDAALIPTDGTEGHRSSILAEGLAMLAALARDAAKDAALDVSVLVDAEPGPPGVMKATWPGGVRVVPVAAGAELETLAAAAAAADWTVVVAPETGGLLADRVEAVRRAGGRPAACGPRFIDVAGDKQATAAALAAGGVPVPAGRSLVAGEWLPDGFRLPAVRKARDGVGCEGLEIVESPDLGRRPATVAERVEAYAIGMPVGVSCLCGAGGIRPLAPVRQRFSAGHRPRYLGGEVVASAAWQRRAEAIATRAIAAVARAGGGGDAARAAGWVGVDIVVGAADDGRDDRVLEVNPRVTTSFVGLAAAEDHSLVRRLLDAAGGLPLPDVDRPSGRTIEFDAVGMLRVHDAR